MSKEFKIIATVRTLEQADIALNYPNTVLRINSSHMETPALLSLIEKINSKYSDPIIFVDLQGSKIRVSRTQPQLVLKNNQQIKLTVEEPTSESKDIHIGHPKAIKLLKKGTKVKIDDGRLELIVDSIESETTATGTITKEGTLRPGKGFNLNPHPFIQNELSPRDKEIVEKCKDFKNVRFALSFACLPEEILDLKARSNNKYIAAKIEREMTIEQMQNICKVSDQIWICRGDMGVQLGYVGMAKFVREFTRDYLPSLKIPVIMAGEVMEHFCEHSSPTRSEMCYLGNCIADGYKGLVLSDETVFGKFPNEAMKFCSSFIREFEGEL